MKKVFLVSFLFSLVVAPFTPVFGAEKGDTNNLIFFVDPIVDQTKVQFEIAARNEGDVPIDLEFANAQLYEIIVTDKEGKQVYQFSEGKGFAQMIHHLHLKPGEDKTWIEILENHELPQDSYKVTAELLAKKLNDQPFDGIIDSTMMKVPAKNPVFKEVSVQGENGSYRVEGLTSTTNDFIYYTVEDGHDQQITETKLKIDHGDEKWTSFSIEISIPQEKLPNNGSLVLHLYERNGMSVLHSSPVVLERFY